MKANNNPIVSRHQEPNSEKQNVARFARKMTFGNTKNKIPTIKENTNIKARPST